MPTVEEIVVRLRTDGRALDAGLAAHERSIGKFSRATERTGKTMTRNLTLPILATIGASAKMALEFDHQFSLIGSLVGASAKQLEAYKAGVLKMGPELGKAPKELAEALYFITSSGFKGAAALRVLRASAKASAAGLGETATVADAVTSAVNAYGEKALSASRATDILLAAVREGKAEPEAFAGAIGRVIPLAEKMGMTFGEVAGMMAAMSLNGTKADEAVTQISAALATAIKPTKQGADALKSVGESYASVRKSIADDGLLATIKNLDDAFDGNIEKLGDVFGNVRALRGILALTGASADKYADIIRDVEAATGDTSEAFDKMAESDMFKLKQGWAELQVVLIKFGVEAVPILLELVATGRDMLDWLNDLDPATRETIVKLGLFVAAAGPMLIVVGKMGRGIEALIKGYLLLRGALVKATVAQVAYNTTAGKVPAATVAGSRGAQLAAGRGAGGVAAAGVAGAGLSTGAIIAAFAAIPVGTVAITALITKDMAPRTLTGETTEGTQRGISGGGLTAARVVQGNMKARAEEAIRAAAQVDDAIARLGSKAATATGAQFTAIRERMMNIQKLFDAGFEFGDLKAEHTDAQLRAIRDRIKGELGITVKEADAIMAAMFKDWRPQAVLMGKIDPAAKAAEKRLDLLRARAAKDIKLGKLDSTDLLNELGKIQQGLGDTRTAAEALSRALWRATSGATGGAGGPVIGSAEGRLVTSPMLTWVGENYRPELILPLEDRKRTLELMDQAGLLDPAYYGGAQTATLGARTPAAGAQTATVIEEHYHTHLPGGSVYVGTLKDAARLLRPHLDREARHAERQQARRRG